MSEEQTTETVVTAEQPAAEAPKTPPAPPPDEVDAETRHAVESLEAKKKRLKVKEAEPEEKTPTEPDKEKKKLEATAAERTSAEEARKRYRERQEKRQAADREAAEYRAKIQELEEGIRARDEAFQRMFQQGGEEPEGVPEELWQQDPKAWYQASIDQALDRKLKPLVERFETEEQQRQRYLQEQEQTRARQAAQQRRLQMLAQAEDEYAATEEGAGYKERLTNFVRNRAAQLKKDGVPPEVAQAFGGDDNAVAHRVLSELDQIVGVAAASGEHPAWYIDQMILSHHPLARPPEANGAEPKAPAAPSLAGKPKSPVEKLQATASAPVAGSLSAGGSAQPTGNADVKQLARSGRVTTADLRRIVNQKAGQGSIRARIRDTVRQLEAAADASSR